MGKVLVEDSRVTCGVAETPHQGTVKMTGAPRLVVDGSRVLTTASIPTPATTTPFPGCTNQPSAGGPCTAVVAITEGASTRLRVDGDFLLLDSLQATTDPGKSQIHVDATSINNDRLQAD